MRLTKRDGTIVPSMSCKRYCNYWNGSGLLAAVAILYSCQTNFHKNGLVLWQPARFI